MTQDVIYLFHVHLRKGWNPLFLGEMQISIRFNWSSVSFKSCISLRIFYLVDLSIGVSGVLKAPTTIVLLLISPFILVSICLTYCGAPMLEHLYLQLLYLLGLIVWSLFSVLLCLFSRYFFKVYFIWNEY